MRIGNFPIEVVEYSYVATEMVGNVLYSTDEDKGSGASMGWIPDYGAGSSELSLDGLVGAFNTALPGLGASLANPGVLSITNTTLAAITNATIMNNFKNANLSIINQSGYQKRKIFYNKPQVPLSDAAAETARIRT